MKKYEFLSLILAVAIFTKCQNHQKSIETILSVRFAEMNSLPDTLHFFLPEKPVGMLISDTLLKAFLDSTQFDKLHFGTGDARFWAVGRLPLSDEMDGFLLQT